MMSNLNPFFPEGFMGMSHENPKIARVCAFCPGKDDADRWATNQGFEISHGICETCVAIQMAKQMDWMLERILP
jgi:hypothetical protein